MTELDSQAQQDAKTAIREALLAQCESALGRVRTEIDSTGEVVIEGEVENWAERQRVEHVVASVPGVRHVECRLIVDDG